MRHIRDLIPARIIQYPRASSFLRRMKIFSNNRERGAQGKREGCLITSLVFRAQNALANSPLSSPFSACQRRLDFLFFYRARRNNSSTFSITFEEFRDNSNSSLYITASKDNVEFPQLHNTNKKHKRD